jgi:hypothetical protein
MEGIDVSVEIATDLSTAQYHFVKISGADNRAVICTAQGEVALGLLQEPVDGSSTTKAGRVRVLGKSKGRMSGTEARGVAITPAADGEIDTAASGDYVHGYLLESGVDQDIKHVVLTGVGGQVN